MIIRRERHRGTEGGFTLMELLVSLFLFGIVGMGITAVMANTFRSLGREHRLASATENLRMAMHVMSTELRMSSNISPYLPGTDASLTNCAGDITQTDDEVMFLITHDDEWATSGLQSYYVAYWYDETNQRLLRGEVWASSTTSCLVPSSSPTELWASAPLAENVVRVDADGDGTDDPIFDLNDSTLTITLGVQVKGEGLQDITQTMQSSVAMRIS